MLYENFLFKGSLPIKAPHCPTLQNNIETECLIIGGGFAGLHAALRLIDSRKKVVLLEKSICGGSSSGQSGGFLTPETEEDMRALIKRYGNKKAKIIHDIPLKGMNMIISNIKKYKFDCDLRKQDSLYFSEKKAHNKRITEEAETRKGEGLPFELLSKRRLKKIHPGKNYILGMKYPGSYGINSFAYCQEMKNLLLKKGVKIYEDSEVHKIEGNTAKTHIGSVRAKKIILCVDKLKAEIDEEFSKKYYHIQTYISVSEPLSKKEMKSLFPKGELMCWDTTWDYTYYRPIAGNRILLGGSSAWTAYLPEHHYSPSVINSAIKNLKKNFPELEDIEFPYYWSGLIDVTKDLVPIVDHDPKNKSLQYVMGCAGLNWAAYCGDYAARKVIDKETEDLTEFLGASRKFFISGSLQKIFGKRIIFAISHLKQHLN